ncbi:UNVERIFIED_CONTAM: hypothetical protein Sradi_2985700 [Sesamum radiatum]|uniref:Uncharacterized protein n=1 Tax=Sesamum radiatum TaxID=300843 RepID=A0AAW2S0H9_SESRA
MHDGNGPTLNEHLLGACLGPSRAGSRHLKGMFRVPERYGNWKGRVGLRWPTLGAKAAERFQGTCKVAPRAVRYQGQHLSWK